MSNPSLRNRVHILKLIERKLFPNKNSTGNFLSIAEGDGVHVELFAKNYPNWNITASDTDIKRVDFMRKKFKNNKKIETSLIDSSKQWPTLPPIDLILNVNMIHISPWEATIGLFNGAGHVLKPSSGILL